MRIVVLTGAGISAESGLPTFRGAGGLWQGVDVRELATPGAFARDPARVQRFYDARRAQLASVQPNAAHAALARLARRPDVELTLVTQNVDDLHERAGSPAVLHMHGELLHARCLACDASFPWVGRLLPRPPCPGCGAARLRPDVVWFGEMPLHMEAVEAALAACDLFAAIGTSGEVWPAAGFVEQARQAGARLHAFNLERGGAFDVHHIGPATRTVPAWVGALHAG